MIRRTPTSQEPRAYSQPAKTFNASTEKGNAAPPKKESCCGATRKKKGNQGKKGGTAAGSKER